MPCLAAQASASGFSPPGITARDSPASRHGKASSYYTPSIRSCMSTSLPFRWPCPAQAPFEITRSDALDLREEARSPRARAIASALPRPVHDGWIEYVFNAEGVVSVYGDAAGIIVAG